MDYLLLTTNDYLLLTDNSKLILSAFSYSNYGWTSSQLTIDATKVSGTTNLTNFPVLVNDVALGTTGVGTAIWSSTRSDGGDIRFSTDSLGTNPLEYELVNWATATQQGEIWVKLGTVQATTNTEFYIWYDNGTATTTSNGTAVFADYEVVLHDVYSGTNSAKADSFGMTSVTATNGAIGTAGNFDGTTSFGTYSSVNPFGTVTTMQGWFKPETILASGGRVFQQGNSLMIFSNEVGTTTRLTLNVDFSSADGQWYDTNNSYNVNANNFVGVTFDTSSDTNDPVFYNNGGTVAVTENVTPSGTAVDISASTHYLGDNGALTRQFDGVLDEYRIRYSILSADWIATEYNNQSNPAGFFVSGVDYTANLLDNLSITDIIYRESNFFRQETNVINLTDDVVRTYDVIATVAQDTIGITDSIDLISLLVVTVAQDTVGITDNVIRRAEFSRQNINTVTATDIIDRVATFDRNLTNNVSLTDSILGSIQIGRSIIDTINVTDTTTYKKITSDVENPIIKFMQIDEIKPTIYNITNG